jgi:putative transposase
MPRRARISLADIPHHIVQRGNNRDACFYSDQDYLFYLECLQENAELTGCSIHAYVLMTNHVHLLVTPQTTDGIGVMMRRLGQRYVQYINRTYKRSGTLWEGRYKSCITSEETYVLACYRYIELNPVAAGMVTHPADYPWSSYRANALGEVNKVVTTAAMYEALGIDRFVRVKAYRGIFRHHLDPGVVDEIQTATQGNYALGSDRFKQQVEAALGRRAVRGVAGRPRKKNES